MTGVVEGGKHKQATVLRNAVAQAKRDGLTVEQVHKHDLNLLVDNRPHQA